MIKIRRNLEDTHRKYFPWMTGLSVIFPPLNCLLATPLYHAISDCFIEFCDQLSMNAFKKWLI